MTRTTGTSNASNFFLQRRFYQTPTSTISPPLLCEALRARYRVAGSLT